MPKYYFQESHLFSDIIEYPCLFHLGADDIMDDLEIWGPCSLCVVLRIPSSKAVPGDLKKFKYKWSYVSQYLDILIEKKYQPSKAFSGFMFKCNAIEFIHLIREF